MAPASDPDLLVLHGLRLKALAPVGALAELTGLDADEIADRLDAFAGKAWVRHRDGGVASGWSLTPAGRVEGAGRLADELEATGARPVVDAAYRAFGVLNQPFLRVCTDWQLRPAVPGRGGSPTGPRALNDHADAAYDRAVIGELLAIDAGVRPVCAQLAGALDRFGGYEGRFGRALRHIEAGDTDWFTRPVLDSYHTVWFELHEDLLATLGLDRSQATGAGRERSA